MVYRRLGKSGLTVSAIACGCMGLSEFRGPVSAPERRAAIRRALDLGITHFDTADFYGDGENETLLGTELRRFRSHVVVSSKGGLVRAGGRITVNGTAAHLRRACHDSLRRLRVDVIDLYYLHRVDPAVPVEESVAAIADLVREGKVRHLGLSKVDAATIARAEAVHPVAAVQRQYSIVRREVEGGTLAECAQRDIALVAYSPLGQGRLTGSSRPTDGARAAAWTDAADLLARQASQVRCTPAQLALAWLLARDERVIALPGIRRPAHADEDAAACGVVVTGTTIAELDSAGAGLIAR